MASFLDDQDARKQAFFQGLLLAGPALMAGGAPSMQPGGLARGLAGFGQGMNQGYRTGMHDYRQGQLTDIQMKMLQDKLAQQDRARKALEGFKPQAQVPQETPDMPLSPTPMQTPIQQPTARPSLMGGDQAMSALMEGLEPTEAIKLMAGQVMKQQENVASRQSKREEMELANKYATGLKLAPGWEKPTEPPKGFEPIPGGLKPIPGGPEDPAFKAADVETKKKAAYEAKRSDAMPKAQAALSALERQTGVVTQNVDKALSLVGPLSTGWGGMLAYLPDTDARALKNHLDTIRANIGFDKLQSMRENSPTGGALGNVSDKETALLQAVNGALDPMQKEQLVDNLKTIRTLYPEVLADRKEAFAQDYGGADTGGGWGIRKIP